MSRFGHAGRLYRRERRLAGCPVIVRQLAKCPVIVGSVPAFGKTIERNGTASSTLVLAAPESFLRSIWGVSSALSRSGDARSEDAGSKAAWRLDPSKTLRCYCCSLGRVRMLLLKKKDQNHANQGATIDDHSICLQPSGRCG